MEDLSMDVENVDSGSSSPSASNRHAERSQAAPTVASPSLPADLPLISPSYDKTYRVQGIPASFNLDDVREFLRSVLERRGEDISLRIHSIGLDPYISGKGAPQVATITLSGLPGPFTDGKDEWTLPAPRSGTLGGMLAVPSITVDSHFRGFTPLNSVDDADHKIEQAIVQLKNGDEVDVYNFKSVYGALFFGVPNQGLRIEQWLPMVKGQANEGLVRILGHDHEYLRKLHQDFRSAFDFVDSVVVSIYETEKTRTAREEQPGKWTLTGSHEILVPISSATNNCLNERLLPMGKSHSDLVKFPNRWDENYRLIVSHLEDFSATASNVIRARFRDNRWLGSQALKLRRESPLVVMPFERNGYFVGREDIIEKMGRQLSKHSRLALYGLGGIGLQYTGIDKEGSKSQIAMEYAYRWRQQSSGASVFWIHGSNRIRFEQAYREIARAAKLPGIGDPNVNTLRLVSDWLTNGCTGQWLLVVDNADDATVFFNDLTHLNTSDVDRVALSEYLPRSSKGSVIFTTRNKRAGVMLTGGLGCVVHVPEMSDSESEKLLNQELKEDTGTQNVAQLSDLLERLPIALVQAAAFIRERSMTISDYINLYHDGDSAAAELLDEDFEDLRRDTEAERSVFKTWAISFNQIRSSDVLAADLLSFMSLLDRQRIPKSLLRSHAESLKKLEDSLGTLKGFSLITADQENKSFDMHRLVQMSTRRWLSKHGDPNEWDEKVLISLSKAFQIKEYETWTIYAELFPHVQAVLSRGHSQRTTILRATLLDDAAWYLYLQGKYEAAEDMGRRALFEKGEALGKDHPLTLTSVNNLALVLRERGRCELAEEMAQQALAGYKKAFGNDHPYTLTCVNNVAHLLLRQGKYDAAEEVSRQALAGRENILGGDHPAMLSSESTLLVALWKKGEVEAAERLGRRVVVGYEKALGKDHPYTLASVRSLGGIFLELGKDELAEEMARRALMGHERMLEEDSPFTLTSLNDLALILGYRGKYDAAEEMSRRAVAGGEKVFGSDHPFTLNYINTLAMVLLFKGKYEAAESLSWRALARREKILGVGHPDTVGSVNNSARVLRVQGKYELAEEMGWRALTEREKLLGIGNLHTLDSVNDLARILQARGKYESAELMSRRALVGIEELFGKNHPQTLASVSTLARVLLDKGEYEAAEDFGRRALVGNERIVGKDHPSTLTIVGDLAQILQCQGMYNAAEGMTRQTLAGREKVLGKVHPSTLDTLRNLALVLQDQGRYEEAEEASRRSLAGCEEALREGHPQTLLTVLCLASILHKRKSYDESDALYRRARDGLEKCLGADHPKTKKCVQGHASLLEDIGRSPPDQQYP
ncbi:hypothetical protein GP486_006316 [Trichoglossum hirsutum]|uniref:DUF7779 domain-containing protein n=1 Tax=Trichoglossum hirsutum TaxID=265104 RepID=A0A9P8L7I9_9PEZI|nr:hypothetical protein GP486_006316 [Trichoglossum hirsutum]